MCSVSGGQVNTLSFSCVKSLYDLNKEYFDSILRSVKVMGGQRR